MPKAISLILTCIIFLILTQPAASFGAGFIPNYAYLNDKAFRHGDIEEILPTLVKSLATESGSSGWLAFAASLFSFGAGAKFSKMDMNRIYFGNWLRDYSQAMDVAGLRRLTAHTLLIAVSVFGFMTFGFATAEFEITPERLGVYLPVEHIDNPKGYAEAERDAREFHPDLRPPVDPQELEVNPNNGMKNYIATEGFAWDTSSAHVRRTLERCIALGRTAQGKECADQFEAFRLLGSALHTLEDLLAHSNWCELALRKLGHPDVFCHVGDEVMIDTPNGPAPPLVTGTFGGDDFIFSVLGEGMDRLSEASMSNVGGTMEKVKNKSEGHLTLIRTLLSKLPILGYTTHTEKMDQAENIKEQAYNFDPNDVAPEEIQRFLWHILGWRDAFYKDILTGIDMIPGLSALVEEITDTLNAFVLTILDPILKPLLQDAIDALQDSSKAVINNADQYEASLVFNDPQASDPSHSILAKDHFGLILNEPAGKIARAVVEYTVNLIVKAWHDEQEDVKGVVDKILEVLHHPYFATPDSEVQRRMMDHLAQWLAGLKPQDVEKTIQALNKQSVREGGNKRLVTEEEEDAPASSGEERVLDPQAIDGEESGQSASDPIPKNTKTEDRGVYYKIRRGEAIFSRFDSLHEEQEPIIVTERWQRYAEKSDEEFWGNPYAGSRSPVQQPQHAWTGAFRNPSHRGYASYAGHQTLRTPADDNPCVPSPVLAEAEAGYYDALNRSHQQRYQTQRRHANGFDRESGDGAFPDEKRGYNGTSSRVVQSSYGYPRNGGGQEQDYAMQPEEGPGPYGRQPRPGPGFAFDRYDAIKARGSGRGHDYPRQPEEGPYGRPPRPPGFAGDRYDTNEARGNGKGHDYARQPEDGPYGRPPRPPGFAGDRYDATEARGNGKGHDYPRQPEDGPYGRPPRPPGFAADRNDAIEPRGSGRGSTYRSVDETDAPPAFFVRTSYPQDPGPYTAGESSYYGNDHKGPIEGPSYGYQGAYASPGYEGANEGFGPEKFPTDEKSGYNRPEE